MSLAKTFLNITSYKNQYLCPTEEESGMLMPSLLVKWMVGEKRGGQAKA
jgi:hypothetical protein